MTRSVRVPQTASLKPNGLDTAVGAGGALKVFVSNDDLNHQLLLILAAEEAKAVIEFTFVDSGAELMTVLRQRLEFGGLPDLILVDLESDGRQTLCQLQTHEVLWQIPVVALANAEAEDATHPVTDMRWCERKPETFDELVRMVESLPARAAQSGFTIEFDHLDLTTRPVIDLAPSLLAVDLSDVPMELSIDLSDHDL